MCVKKSLLLSALLLAVVFQTSCTTLANRRDLYSYEGPEGPYTQMLHNR